MDFIGRKWTNEKILQKIGAKRIRSLGLLDTSADDVLLHELADRTSLTSLEIDSDLISDEGIASIVRACKIVSLLLQNAPQVTDAVLPAIVSCRTLRELYLINSQVSDHGIGVLSGLPDLHALSLCDTAITDAGIDAIASRSIDLISFDRCPIVGTGFASWSHDQKMSFYAEGSSLDDEGFVAACGALPWMWNVVIADTDVGDRGVMALGPDGPTGIRLRGSKVTSKGIEWLVRNTPVQGIEADNSQITEAQASALQKVRRDLSIYLG